MEGRGMICMPGFVDTHWHLWTSLLRPFVRADVNELGYFPVSNRHHLSDPGLREQCPICVNVTPLRRTRICPSTSRGREGCNVESTHFGNRDNWGWDLRGSAINGCASLR